MSPTLGLRRFLIVCGVSLAVTIPLGAQVSSSPSLPAGNGTPGPGSPPGPPATGLGHRIVVLEDRNGDGIAEYAVSRPNDNGTTIAGAGNTDQGAIEFRDGATGAALWTRSGLAAGEFYGRSLCAVDWNGDGIHELATIAQGNAATARLDILDTIGGNFVASLPIPASAQFGNIGESMTAGDIDGDGLEELLVSTTTLVYSQIPITTAPAGKVVVFSPTRPSQVIGSLDDGFGIDALVTADIDGDGWREILISAPYADRIMGGATLTDAGVVTAFSGASLATIWQIVGGAGDQLGYHMLAGPDLNGDGQGELIASHGFDCKRIAKIDVLAGSLLANTFLVVDGGCYGDMELVSDRDGDGLPELAIPGVNGGSPMISIASITTGHYLDNRISGFFFQSGTPRLAFADDSNGDGNPEMIVGSSKASGGFGGVGRIELPPCLSELAKGTLIDDIVRIDGTTGGPARRQLRNIGQPFTIEVQPTATSALPTDFILWGLIGRPNASSAFTVSGGATFLFPPRIAAPGLPWLFCLADSLGFDPAAAFPATAAPWRLVAPLGLPFAVDLTFQGVSVNGTTIEITNGILLQVH